MAINRAKTAFADIKERPSVLDVCRLWHSRPKLDHLAIHSELAVSVMVDGLRIFLRLVGPGPKYFKDKEIVLVDEKVSATLHSRLAKHSATRRGATHTAGAGVRPILLNLSTSRPEQLPIAGTLGASCSAETEITHSFVACNVAKL
jgi:hypothetical protein